MAQQEPEVLLKLLWQEMERCHDAIMRGEIHSLEVIETKIQEFCEVVKAMPGQDMLRFQDDFKALLEKLVEWSQLLEQRKKVIEKELKSLNIQAKAQAAYRIQTSFRKPDNEQ